MVEATKNNIDKYVITFSKNIKKLRQRRMLNIRELSDKVGIGYTTLIRYERGIKPPSLIALVKLSEYFSLAIDDLIGRNHIMQEAMEKECDTNTIVRSFMMMDKINRDRIIKIAEILQE